MSIIGIVWFTLSLILILVFSESDNDAALGWGILGMLYAIPFAISVLVNQTKKNKKNITEELLSIAKLKENGVLTEEEFQTKKYNLLKEI